VLSKFLSEDWDSALNTGEMQVLAALAVLRSRFDYAARDSETTARSLVELAFEHLRRSIVVNPDIRRQWEAGLKDRETACERLGAVHLLAHGIWAFKVAGGGQATDLVLAEPLAGELDRVQRVARTIALTEWKLVRRRDNLNEIAREAREQAKDYASGILGTLELNRRDTLSWSRRKMPLHQMTLRQRVFDTVMSSSRCHRMLHRLPPGSGVAERDRQLQTKGCTALPEQSE
jgi:hypothetical protein